MATQEQAANQRSMSRRCAIGAIAGGAAGVVAGCSRARSGGEVVLYSSVDDFVLREVTRGFEATTGIRVRLLGDTEATKTTGLVQRLASEADDPRADVWWSSEPFGTVRLASMGLFEPIELELPPTVVEAAFEPALRAEDSSWYGMALRARVIGVFAGRFTPEETPRTLGALTRSRYEGRVGMAQPRFGTTRGHMASLYVAWGEGRFGRWLEAMRANGLRLYSGNSTVVRGIADGEIDAGLTDTDDVWGARRNDWPVEAVYEVDDAVADPPSFGPMLIPNTVARVRGGPNASNARTLMDYLLAGPAEEILAVSDSHNIPMRHGPFPDLAQYGVPGGWVPDIATASSVDEQALTLCESILGQG